MVDLAVEDLGLARAAGAVRARVGQPDPGAQARVEHRLVRAAGHGGAKGLDRDGVLGRHGQVITVMNRSLSSRAW